MKKPTLQQASELIKLARASIADKKLPSTSYDDEAGVFVTLEKNGSLRGCIGFITAGNVRELVIKAAKSAAFEDPRFPPLTEKEMSEVSVEISLLSKPEPCHLEEIKEGDGVILKKDFRSALFLPQVWEQLPDKKDFLSQLAFKAGMANYDDCVFEKFEITSFKQ